MNDISYLRFYGVEKSFWGLDVLIYVDMLQQGDPGRVRLFQVPGNADVEVLCAVNGTTRIVLILRVLCAPPPFGRRLLGLIILHRPIPSPTDIQSGVPTRLHSTVTCSQQLVQLILCWPGNAEDEEPAIALEIGDPFQAFKLYVKRPNGSPFQAGAESVYEFVSMVCSDLQRARKRDVERQRRTEFRS